MAAGVPHRKKRVLKTHCSNVRSLCASLSVLRTSESADCTLGSVWTDNSNTAAFWNQQHESNEALWGFWFRSSVPPLHASLKCLLTCLFTCLSIKCILICFWASKLFLKMIYFQFESLRRICFSINALANRKSRLIDFQSESFRRAF